MDSTGEAEDSDKDEFLEDGVRTGEPTLDSAKCNDEHGWFDDQASHV